MCCERIGKKIKNPKIIKLMTAILLIYTFMCGQELKMATDLELNVHEYVLYMITNHYYMVYVWLFFVIIFSIYNIREKRPLERVRFGKISLFYKEEIIVSMIQLFIVIVSHIMIAYIVGNTRLAGSVRYSDVVMENICISEIEVLQIYALKIYNPIIAMLEATIVWYVGSLFIVLLIYFGSEVLNGIGEVILILGIIANVMMGFMTEIDSGILKIFFINNYYIFHHTFEGDKELVVLNLTLMFVIIRVLYKKAVMINTGSKRLRILNDNKVAIMQINPYIECIYLVGINVILLINSEQSGMMYIWNAFKGFSYENFQFVEFLSYVSCAMLALYAVNAKWSDEINNKNTIWMFRFNNKNLWNKKMYRNGKLLVNRMMIEYIVTTSIIGNIIQLIYNGNTEWYAIAGEYYGQNNRTVIISIFIAVLLRVVEMNILYICNYTIYRITHNSICAYIAIIVLWMVGIWSSEMNLFILGKGSVYQIMEMFAKQQEDFLIWIVLVNVLFAVFIETIALKNFDKMRIVMKKWSELVCQK